MALDCVFLLCLALRPNIVYRLSSFIWVGNRKFVQLSIKISRQDASDAEMKSFTSIDVYTLRPSKTSPSLPLLVYLPTIYIYYVCISTPVLSDSATPSNLNTSIFLTVKDNIMLNPIFGMLTSRTIQNIPDMP